MWPLGVGSLVFVQADRTFYRDWIVANAVAEAAGLGTTFVLGYAAAPALKDTTAAGIILTAALALVLGVFLEGVLVGYAQERVLRRRLVRIEPRHWMIATAIGAGAAWALGMIPSTVMSLMTMGQEAAAAPAEPPPLVQYGLGVALGLVTGPILGVAQWAVLRRAIARHAARWLWANAAAWAIGMPLIFLGMDFVPWDGPPAAIAASIYLVCAVTGLVVGAIHGRVLVALTATAVEGAIP